MTSGIMKHMEYTFSWGWFAIGLLALLASVALTVWHRPIADNFGSGVVSYERYRLWGLIGCGLSLVFMLNLHTLFLSWFFSMLFDSASN